MTIQTENVLFLILVFRDELRSRLCDLLVKNHLIPGVVTGVDELLGAFKRGNDAIVFIESEVVNTFGSAVYMKVKTACHGSRIILLCEHSHRDLIKEAMAHGVYGCVLEPYREWEVMSMVKPILADIGKKTTRSRKG